MTHAENEGWLEQGDFVEAINLTESVGDPPWVPQDSDDAHGTPRERVRAHLRGYLDGIEGCDLVWLPGRDGAAATRTPTPTPIATLPGAAIGYLPDLPALQHAHCFRLIDGGTLSLETVAGRLADLADPRSRLEALGWRDGTFRQFGCDGPPSGQAGWIEVNVHVFADAAGGQRAVAVFTEARAAGTLHSVVPAPSLGDAAMALTGLAVNGTEVTIYASSGTVLLRVTGVSPSGDPASDVAIVVDQMIHRTAGASGPPPQGRTSPTADGPARSGPSSVPVSAYLPDAPALPHAACFVVENMGTYPEADVAAYLAGAGATARDIAALGWRDGAYVDFRCEGPPAGRAGYVGVVVHRFVDAAAADRAVAYWLQGHAPAANEAWSCGADGSLLVCVSATAEGHAPWPAIRLVLRQVLSAAP